VALLRIADGWASGRNKPRRGRPGLRHRATAWLGRYKTGIDEASAVKSIALQLVVPRRLTVKRQDAALTEIRQSAWVAGVLNEQMLCQVGRIGVATT